jgi:hypothetical protein
LSRDIEILAGDLQTQFGGSKAQIVARYRRSQADQDVATLFNGRVRRGLCRFLASLGFPEQVEFP